MAGAAQRIDEAALTRWLEANMPGFRGPAKAQKFAGGQSNPTFLVTAPSGRWVLRRKPPGQLLKSAHAVDREYRVMKALAGTGVPVPTMHALCEDDAVIGSMFFLMEHVDGRIFWDPSLPGMANAERTAIFDQMNTVLAALHTLDPAAVGLGDFGRPGNYFERQVSRWTQQYRASETGTIPAMDRLIAWLPENTPPEDGRVALVHGDFRLDNMIFHPTEPRIVALLDWELSTLGHPFADLSYQCMQWRMPPGDVTRGLAGLDRTALGIPSEEQYVAAYCRRTGVASVSDWAFCLAYNFFRMAAIVQGVKKRALDGNASNPERALTMGEFVRVYAEKGAALIEGGAA